MKELRTNLSAAPVTMFSAVTTTRGIRPATGSAAYVAAWNSTAGTVPEFDLRLRAGGSNAITALELFAGSLEALVVADDDFTATHGTETFTAASHGLETGDGPIYLSNAGGALPAGVSAATAYYVIRVDANDFKLATSRANALAGTAQAITGNGTGTHTLSDSADTTRIHYRSDGLLLGPAADGAVSLTIDKGYRVRCKHAPDIIAYAVIATFGSAVATYCDLVAVAEK